MVVLNQSYAKNTTEDSMHSCNKPVVAYNNLDQNMCNNRLLATEETKKRSNSFPEAFMGTFLCDMRNIEIIK